ncbi:MAG: 50S ribosomal protein L30 [Chloroflexota bacterium]
MRLLEVTYERSSIGRPQRQKRTVAALGLTRLHQTVRHPNNDAVRGMVASVQHLVSCREIEEGEKHETA